MQSDLEILITAWRLKCEYLQRHAFVNNTVKYTTVVHKEPCIILDYKCDFFSSGSFQNPRLCITQSFFNYLQKLHMSVKAVLNHTEYIFIWYFCVKIYGPTYEDGYWRINVKQEVYTKN